MSPAKRRKGFSIVELMIALAVMAIVSSQLLLVFSAQHDSYVEQEHVIDTQQDVRLVSDVILTDLRMAGYMLEHKIGVGSNDGGTGAPDVVCMSDPSAIVDAEAAAATGLFAGADVTGTLGGSEDTVTVSVGDLDIDSDGNDDFSATNGGIIISDGTTVHCAIIESIAGNTITFTPDTPASASFTANLTSAAPALVYVVNNNRLTRNGVVLSLQIEDLQIQFGVDDDNDGMVENTEFPIDSLNAAAHDLSAIKTARIFVTSRSMKSEPEHSSARTAAANRLAGTTDNFKRRRVTADVGLRNMR
jgi:prepilin-type N-terminal cleavage/methylation domain-containing protein